MTRTVLVGDANGVRTITLNRPERLNALNAELLADLTKALLGANGDDTVRAVVLSGAGRAFCSGDDLKDFEQQTRGPDVTRRFVEAIQDVSRAIVLGPKVVVGAVHGWAVGGGLEWVINCDLPILGESTKCFFPELAWGMFPTGGVTALLPRLIGLQKTRALMIMGTRFTAGDALAMGLAYRVVPDAQLFEVAQETAEHVASLPQSSVRSLKRVLLHVAAGEFEKALDLETKATIETMLEPETLERVRAFKS